MLKSKIITIKLKNEPPFFNSYIIDTLDETKKYKINIDFLTREDAENGVNEIIEKARQKGITHLSGNS